MEKALKPFRQATLATFPFSDGFRELAFSSINLYLILNHGILLKLSPGVGRNPTIFLIQRIKGFVHASCSVAL